MITAVVDKIRKEGARAKASGTHCLDSKGGNPEVWPEDLRVREFPLLFTGAHSQEIRLVILSFAWTTDALLSGKKTCTRWQWSDRKALAWLNAYHQGRLVHQAWTNAPFVRGAKKVADIRLTQLPYQEQLADMPESDLEAEGGLWANKEEFLNLFSDPDLIVWVVRFELFQVANSCRGGLA